ncbi:hypothetical protein [Streptomyces sp. NPDC088246]|uniref:hypothetical protein n=1 Tax=Streptomyces sp. NPDC088246 TaxID=3365842 RepID=UPI00382D302F
MPAGTDETLANLTPAAASAALRLLAGAIRRGAAHDDVVEALKQAGVHYAFADVLDAAFTAVMNGLDDPYECDGRLHADNLPPCRAEGRWSARPMLTLITDHERRYVSRKARIEFLPILKQPRGDADFLTSRVLRSMGDTR